MVVSSFGFNNPNFIGLKAEIGSVQTGQQCFAGSVQSRSKYKFKVNFKGVHNKSFKLTALRAAA
jgi:hypothetical protein